MTTNDPHGPPPQWPPPNAAASAADQGIPWSPAAPPPTGHDDDINPYGLPLQPPQPPPPPAPPYQSPFVQPAYPQPAPTNGLAVSGMIVGIVAACLVWLPVVNYILAVVAISLSGTGLARSRKIGGVGQGPAIAGIVLGIATMIFWWVIWGVMTSSVSTP